MAGAMSGASYFFAKPTAYKVYCFGAAGEGGAAPTAAPVPAPVPGSVSAPVPAGNENAGNGNASGGSKKKPFPLGTVLVVGGGVVGVGLLAWIIRSILTVWRGLKEKIARLEERVTVLEGGAGASMVRSLALHEIGRQHGRGGAGGAPWVV